MKPLLALADTSQARNLSWSEWLVLGSLLALCLTVALTQEVSPFPVDGWFVSQYRIFARIPGGDNYTPVAAPAYLYFSVHILAKMLGLGLEEEFYLGCLAHNLCVFLAGMFLYLSHRLLGMPRMGLLVSALVVVYIQSILMAQAFWSENVSLLLMSVIVYCVIRILVRTDDARRSFITWSLALGFIVGLFVITRLVPIVLVPGFIWLFHRQLERHRARLASSTVVLCVIAVVLVAMSANLWRYDRFELSNSAGRHLWQNISPWADEMLAGSAEYQALKRADPAIAGRKWWDVENASVPGLEHFSREELLRLLSWQAITSHPVRYFRIGVGNTLRLLLDAPWRLGLAKGDFNPLARNSMLPPLLPSLPRLEYGLRLVHRGSLAVWPLFTYGVLTAWAAGALVHRWSRLRRGQEPRRSITDSLSSERSQDLADSLGGFLAFGVVASLWLTCQIEAPLDRYQLPYLPMLAMLMSISFARWIHFARPGTRT